MAYGRLLGRAGRMDEAVERFGRASSRFTEIGDERLALATRSDLGHALRRAGRLPEAEAIYRETIGGWVHLGHRGAVANQLENVAFASVEDGRLERASRLLGAAEALREAAASPPAWDEGPELEAYAARVREGLAAETFATEWAAGRALSLADAVAAARAD